MKIANYHDHNFSIPDDAKFIASDADGQVYAYTAHPASVYKDGFGQYAPTAGTKVLVGSLTKAFKQAHGEALRPVWEIAPQITDANAILTLITQQCRTHCTDAQTTVAHFQRYRPEYDTKAVHRIAYMLNFYAVRELN